MTEAEAPPGSQSLSAPRTPVPGRTVFFTAILLSAAAALSLPVPAAAQAGDRRVLIRVAVDPTRPPYQFWRQDRLAGFNVELMSRIGSHQNVQIVFLPMNREECLRALEDGRADGILGYPFDPGDSARMDFSEPLASSSIGILVPKDGRSFGSDLSGLTDGVLSLTRDSPAYDFLESIRAIRFNETAVPSDAFELLARGRADALLEDRMTLRHFLQERSGGDRFRFAASYWLPVEYTLAVAKDRFYLLYLVNTGLRAMKDSGVYSALFERWFRVEEYETRRKLQRLLGGFIAFALVSALLGAASFWWTRQLSSRVRERTADLHDMNEELVRQVNETEDKKEFINQILESSPRGIVTCDRSGIVTMCNRRAREIGRMEGDPVGTPYGGHPLLARFLGGRVESILGQDKRYPFETEEWESPDGAVLHIRYGLYPLLNHDRAVEGVIFSFEDDTRRKMLQDRIFEREKNRALGQLVAGIAHEIRNPLTSIKTFVELLPRKAGNPQFLREMANHVPKEVDRVDGLIRNLIDFSRPRAASGTRQDIGDLVDSCAGLLGPMVGRRGYRLRGKAARGLYAVLDRDQFKQCVFNFVLNAADALDELDPEILRAGEDRTEILLEALAGPDTVRVAVRDRGVGMTDKEIARALEPFYTTKAKGLGLGLPLTRQYIEENRGTLRIESRKGQGTSMIMEFPREGA